MASADPERLSRGASESIAEQGVRMVPLGETESKLPCCFSFYRNPVGSGDLPI